MEQYTPILEYLKSNPNASFTAKQKSPLTGFCLLVAGIAVFIVSLKAHLSDTARMLILTVGTLLAAVGAVLVAAVFVAGSSRFLYKATGARLRHFCRYINGADRQLCRDLLTQGRFDQLSKIPTTNSGSFRLQIYLSDDHAVALIQLEEFVPHQFQPATPVAIAEGKEVQPVADYLKG